MQRKARLAALLAWCEMRADFRQFRLDRIENVQGGEIFPHEPARERAMFRLFHRAQD